MDQTNHKTVFVLDHGPSMSESSKQNVDLDIVMKTRAPGMIPLAPVTKSLWTACIESLCEYCRIVWDIYPSEKFLKFVGSDESATSLNSWETNEQTLEHLMESLANYGPPGSSGSIKSGLECAVQSCTEMTDVQLQAFQNSDNDKIKIPNKARIICITQLKSKNTATMVETIVQECVTKANEFARSSKKKFLPISCLDLVIVHVKPFGVDYDITEKSEVSLDSIVRSEVVNVKATRHGIAIANRMLNLVQRQYDLSVTSVSGIPMKEEQHANSSANYDVLLLHPRLPGTIDKDAGAAITSNDGEPVSTMMLKWFSPKVNPTEIYYCQAAVRISPVDVNSRPSLCLTNFLLSGRSVLLERWSKDNLSSNNRLTTHIITCHRNDIFLHALTRDRPAFEDPPSISEGPGGKVTDYRINDFVDLIKEVQLYPSANRSYGVEPLKLVETKLNRLTKHWPLVFSKTTLFNITKMMEPLLSLILKDELTEDEFMECQKVIYHMIKCERENVPLHISTFIGRPKSNKKDEQYRMLWNELETYLRLHCTTSTRHREVLNTLLQCLNKASEVGDSEIFESPESPPPLKKVKEEGEKVTIQKDGQSLHEMWWKRIEDRHQQNHVEFYGRLMGNSNIAQLYPHLVTNVNTPPERENNDRNDNRRHGHYHSNQRSLTPSGRSTPTGRLTPSGGNKSKGKRDKNKNYS